MSDEIKKLMEIASQPLQKPIKKTTETYASNVYRFINDCEIVSHDSIFVDVRIVYHKYYKWCHDHQLKPKSKRLFNTDFRKKFEVTEFNNRLHFFISPVGFDLSIQNAEDAAKLYTEVKSEKDKKERKTRKPKNTESTES